MPEDAVNTVTETISDVVTRDFWFEREFFNNTIAAWIAAGAIFLIIWIVLLFIRGFIAGRLKKLNGAKRHTKALKMVGELLGSTNGLVIFIVALYAGLNAITIPEQVAEIFDVMDVMKVVVIVAVFLQVLLWTNAAVTFWCDYYRQKFVETDPSRAMIIGAFSFLSKLVLFVVIFLLALTNLGIEVGPLLASVGVAGIAIGLALQTILSDIFASLTIVFDKPFVVGDFIIVDDKLGTVEHVGLKTTRVRSLWGEQLVFANSDLLASRIRNYKKMQERRIQFNFGVIYQTPYDKLKTIPGIVREIVSTLDPTPLTTWQKLKDEKGIHFIPNPLVRFDRAHFKGYGESSLDFEVVYYIHMSDFNMYMDVQEAINLELYLRFEDAGIDFAYPTRTLYIARQDDQETESSAGPVAL